MIERAGGERPSPRSSSASGTSAAATDLHALDARGARSASGPGARGQRGGGTWNVAITRSGRRAHPAIYAARANLFPLVVEGGAGKGASS